MVVLSKLKGSPVAVESPFTRFKLRVAGKRLLADNLQLRGSGSGSGSASSYNHVVIVIDALEEFCIDALKWALENIVTPGCSVTLLALMPWLNIPLFSKTWSEVWAVDFEGMTDVGWNNDAKYQKLQSVLRLCRKHKVVPQKKVEMGYPRRLLVVEQVTSLHATWVVFDRHHNKYREYFGGIIPCNMVVMNEDGTADMINNRRMVEGEATPSESPASLAPTPKLILSNGLKEFLKERGPLKDGKD